MLHSSTSKDYRLDINGLRAYAVLAVLLFHFEILGFQAGFLGVDIFFVISGFLMTGIITKGIEKQNFGLFKFYMARIRRIMPVLIVLILTLLGLGWFWLTTVDYKALANQSGSALAFISNIFFWRTSGYFDTSAHDKWLLHTWTLGVEFQFYILLPLYLLLTTKIKSGARPLLYGLLIAFIASLGLSIFLSTYRPTAAFYLLPTRGWEFLAGGLVYLLGREFPQLQRFAKAYLIIGFALLLISMFVINSKLAWPSAWALLPVLGTSLIILAKQENSILTVNPIAQWLGNRSYSIYLWHWPVVVALYYIERQDNPLWISFGVLLSILLGHLSYQFIENPTREFLSSAKLSKQVAIMTSLVLLTGLSAVSVKYLNFNGRVPQAVEIAAAEQKNTNSKEKSCFAFPENPTSPNCLYGKGKIAAILRGDSHALATVTAFQKVAEKQNQSILFWGMSGCPTLDNAKFNLQMHFPINSCNIFNEKLDKQLINYPKTPLVLISRTSSYVLGMNDIDRKPEWGLVPTYFTKKYIYINEPGFKEEFSKVLVDTACRLAKDRQVFLMRPVPEFIKPIPQTLSRQIMMTGKIEDIKLPLTEYHKRNKIVWAAQDKAAAKCGVKILNPLPYLCDSQYCYGSKNGRPLYSDDDHLSEYGNKFLTPMFEQVFAK